MRCKGKQNFNNNDIKSGKTALFCTFFILLSKTNHKMPINIAIFASGSGSNAQNIIQYFEQSNHFVFPLIVTNKADAYVHQRAKALNIKSVYFSKDEFTTGENILKLLCEYGIDAIILAGFLLKVPDSLINAYPDRIINIHPALLPKFGGKGMYGDNVHRAVRDSGDTESGITIHYVNRNYDEGNIIFQAKCSVEPSDSYEDIARKVHELEYVHFPKVIEQLWK